MIHIQQATDNRVDDFRDLKHSDNRPDLPGGKGLIIAEGPLVVGRLLRSRCSVRSIVGFPAKLEKFLADSETAQLVAEANIPVYSIDRETLAHVAGYDMHRGLLAAADRPAALDIDEAIKNARTIAILEGVGDHENIGAMFRNAAGMGVDAILFGNGCADPLYRRVVRVSMGHVLRLPFAHFGGKSTTWHRELQQLVDAGFHLVSLTPDSQADHLADALIDDEGNAYKKVALLVGAEGPGLSEHAMRATHVRARIPMAPETDSLNLATAAAIAFYERDRSIR
ncbi:tRNA/rRNA methyltransferase SpoU [Corynebacterium kutscheri]|uniref:rRNA methylase n=1 Tax=Corynebacterium kutscheri TaxID=35755 RepID=A0A0F6R1J1_9CORY|nr:RNA methyltransferase [Corynebacterium kutscheri]AKE41885.1 rRNA methylase [Corynebacterium kutscheri]VEH04420.1 tRNA/rRNA methyltransferase SpoU [Corynebacterium kutscheri]VEH10213.1 tRNA/rRNA methyltransferase SpoU [Corynebacterium kutscheri]VEH80295.1 tRNA/rRNA methyltransferase SpoU [Corynebacterium kutscheri]